MDEYTRDMELARYAQRECGAQVPPKEVRVPSRFDSIAKIVTVGPTAPPPGCASCRFCGGTRFLNDDIEANCICVTCGMTSSIAIHDADGSIPFTDLDSRVVTASYSYKRVNHFRDWIHRLQASNDQSLPRNIIDAVAQQIQQHAIPKPVTPQQIRRILRHIDMSRYYTCCVALANIVNGVSAPYVSVDVVEKLCTLFEMIQAPFERVKPNARSNFLSYSFVIVKLCRLIGETQLCRHANLLKSAEKLSMQDEIWQAICNELKWPFHASI